MSKVDIRTVESTADNSTGNFTRVTGSDVTVGGVEKRALDTFVAGGDIGVTPTGLKTAGIVTEVTLNDTTWTDLPATPQTDRNTIAIQNPTSILVKINFATPVGFEGWELNPGGEFFTDITDAITIRAKAESGTPIINVLELS